MTRISAICFSLALGFLAGCGDDGDPETTQGTTPSNETATPTMELVSMRDPVEDAFFVQVPKGWFNRAYSTRVYDIKREVVTCVSPNSDTVLFIGDASLPQYWNPDTANQVTHYNATLNPVMKIEYVQPAQTYFATYAMKKYGKLPGFKAEAPTPNPEMLQELHALLAEHKMQAKAEIVTVPFTYQEKGREISALLIGQILDFHNFWLVDVCGISTAGKAQDFLPMLRTVVRTKKPNPEWQAKFQAQHEQRMAEIRAHGKKGMDWIQASAQRHQKRMQAIWAAGDASVRNFYERSAASDRQHQGFINTINGEHTVVSSSGKTWQVDNSYDRYFVNKNDNSYIGGDIRLDADEIRRRGFNPDDYEEVKIRN